MEHKQYGPAPRTSNRLRSRQTTFYPPRKPQQGGWLQAALSSAKSLLSSLVPHESVSQPLPAIMSFPWSSDQPQQQQAKEGDALPNSPRRETFSPRTISFGEGLGMGTSPQQQQQQEQEQQPSMDIMYKGTLISRMSQQELVRHLQSCGQDTRGDRQQLLRRLRKQACAELLGMELPCSPRSGPVKVQAAPVNIQGLPSPSLRPAEKNTGKDNEQDLLALTTKLTNDILKHKEISEQAQKQLNQVASILSRSGLTMEPAQQQSSMSTTGGTTPRRPTTSTPMTFSKLLNGGYLPNLHQSLSRASSESHSHSHTPSHSHSRLQSPAETQTNGNQRTQTNGNEKTPVNGDGGLRVREGVSVTNVSVDTGRRFGMKTTDGVSVSGAAKESVTVDEDSSEDERECPVCMMGVDDVDHSECNEEEKPQPSKSPQAPASTFSFTAPQPTAATKPTSGFSFGKPAESSQVSEPVPPKASTSQFSFTSLDSAKPSMSFKSPEESLQQDKSPSFSFGTTSSESITKPVVEKPSFSFGTTSSESTTKPLPEKPSFSFGTTSPKSTTKPLPEKPSFSFGMTSPDTAKPFAQPEKSPSFSFGVTSPDSSKPQPTPATPFSFQPSSSTTEKSPETTFPSSMTSSVPDSASKPTSFTPSFGSSTEQPKSSHPFSSSTTAEPAKFSFGAPSSTPTTFTPTSAFGTSSTASTNAFGTSSTNAFGVSATNESTTPSSTFPFNNSAAPPTTPAATPSFAAAPAFGSQTAGFTPTTQQPVSFGAFAGNQPPPAAAPSDAFGTHKRDAPSSGFGMQQQQQFGTHSMDSQSNKRPPGFQFQSEQQQEPQQQQQQSLFAGSSSFNAPAPTGFSNGTSHGGRTILKGKRRRR